MKLYDVNSLEQEDLVCSGQSTYSRDDLDSKVKKGKVFSDWTI